MNGKDADDKVVDKVVVDPALLEEAAASRARATTTRAEEPRAFARGTRDRVHCPNSSPPVSGRSPLPVSGRSPPPVSGRSPLPVSGRSPLPAPGRGPLPAPGRSPLPAPGSNTGPRELERDPVAVLRAWPHSTARNDVPRENARVAPPPPRAQRRVQDKITLAHFALDLFSEVDELQAIVQRVDDASDRDPDHAGCTHPSCAAKLDVMRGALLEACLLVQRVAMTPPGEPVDIEDRIHELLELLR